MPARLRARNGRHTVIRPLCYVWEQEIADYARAMEFPVICCGCPGCLDPTLNRHRIKTWLRHLEKAHPGLKRSLLAAPARVDVASLPTPRVAARRAGARLPRVAGEALAAKGFTEGG
jgi:tRNA 2-thiocytidine biosynthesis protein TtcA